MLWRRDNADFRGLITLGFTLRSMRAMQNQLRAEKASAWAGAKTMCVEISSRKGTMMD